MKVLQLAYLLLLIETVILFNTSSPTWITSNYFKADSNDLIATKTGNSSTPQHTFTFSSAFSLVPNLAYGIKQYKGDDKLVTQKFQINRLTCTVSTFRVQVQIVGYTNVLKLSVAYIAVDPLFPHHLNSFDNVPLNYSAGVLNNIDTTDDHNIRFYLNIIDYSAQASSMNHHQFLNPISRNKVLLFISTLHYNGSWSVGSTHYGANFHTQIRILNNSHYSLKTTVNPGNQIHKLHFSQIIFDLLDVQSSKQYIIQFYQISFPQAGGTFTVPGQFINNFIMGLISFKSFQAQCGLFYHWVFDAVNDIVTVQPSISTGSYSACALTQQNSMVFYIKTWQCPASHPYYNLITQLCQDGCSNYQYQNNTSPASCQSCYYSCQACSSNSSTSCTACNNVTDHRQLLNLSCQCLSGYHQNYTINSICLLCSDSVNNCSSCTTINITSVSCNNCDQGFYLFSNTACMPCSTSINQCYNCSLDGSICYNCNQTRQYFLNSTLQCQRCTLMQCLQCQSLTTCKQCNETNNYFINLTTYMCQNCVLAQCLVCISLTECSQCNQTNNYFLDTSNITNTTNTCILCTLNQCIDCVNLTVCQTCNNSNNYFLNQTTWHCQLCNIVGCLICLSLQQCQTCNLTAQYTLYLQNGTNFSLCQFCNSTLDYFINSSAPIYYQCSLCSINHCIDCLSISFCSICNSTSNYHLNSTTQLCQLCSLSNCIQCLNLYDCLICNNTANYYLNSSNNQCQICNIVGCIKCLTLQTCQICNLSDNYQLTSNFLCDQCSQFCNCDGYALPKINGLCSGICGDGLLRSSEKCDDGNIKNNDGCSSECRIQQNWICRYQGLCCQVNIPIQLTLLSLMSIPQQNNIQVTIMLTPYFPIFQQKPTIIFTKQLIKTNLSDIVVESLTYLQLSKIKVVLKFSKTHHSQIINLSITTNLPPIGPFCNHLPINLSIPIKAIPTNNLPMVYYNTDDLKSYQNVKKLFSGIQISSYISLIASLFSCKIIGVQLFGVLQLAFFTLADNDQINLILTPLTNMKNLNGFNIILSSQQDRYNHKLPNRISALGYSVLFIDNCNVMIIIIFINISIGIFLYFLSIIIIKYSNQLKKMSKYILKQVLLTIIIFNSFNLAFSATIHFTYSTGQQKLYTISSFFAILGLLLPIIMIFAIFLTQSAQFGEYRSKFKKDTPSQINFVINLIYRMALGCYIASSNEHGISTLIIISFSLGFLMYSLINLPFIEVFHNYRNVICHLSILISLFVTMYYRSMKSTQSIENRAYNYKPAYIEIISLVISIIISIVVLIYEIYKYILQKCQKNQQKIKLTQHSIDFKKRQESQISVAHNQMEQQPKPSQIDL